MMKTVRHAIWGPIHCEKREISWCSLKLRVCGFFSPSSPFYFRCLEGLAIQVRTEILDMDDTRLLQAGILDSGVLRVGNHAAVTSLGDAQTVNRGAGSFSDSIV
jgi:hypothetical protein